MSQTDAWCNAFNTQLIVGAALLEGAAFFLAIMYMVTGDLVNLLAMLPFVLLLALKFPTRSALDSWMDKQRSLLDQERAELR